MLTLTQLRSAEAAALAPALKTMPGLSSSLMCLSRCTCKTTRLLSGGAMLCNVNHPSP